LSVIALLGVTLNARCDLGHTAIASRT
jgi:hypothetical protein